MNGIPALPSVVHRPTRWAGCRHDSAAAIESDREMVARITRRCSLALLAANAVGGALVFGFGFFVVPVPAVIAHDGNAELANLILFAVLMPAGLAAGMWWSLRLGRRSSRWLREGRDPTPEERTVSLRHPARQTLIEATLWGGAALAFVTVNSFYSVAAAFECGVEIVIGGLTTCAITYLLTERITRPIIARALDGSVPNRPAAPGVACRMMLAWTFGSVVPLAGLGLVGVAALAHARTAYVSTGLAVLLIAAVGVVVGLVMVGLTAKTLAEPLRSLRAALARVERGQLDTAVEVDDASEVGQVQAGFNRMVAGLRDRDRLRDLFGRHVGEEVARDALERHQVRLGGETRHAAVLFVDLIGSTALASSREPAEVVAELNAFFAIVVDCVSLHGGWVNKFEGDAALCVFGAPTTHPDGAGSALATARALATRLERELVGIEAAIGVSAGTVVAGNVGTAERFEYTVIGDPVNEAARLTELAKSEPGRVLASDAAVRCAQPQERERWSNGRSVTLRGRREPTTVASPRRAAGPRLVAAPS